MIILSGGYGGSAGPAGEALDVEDDDRPALEPEEPAAGEVKKNHTVVRARTQKGEAVDLHVDRGGYIYKQIWVRP